LKQRNPFETGSVKRVINYDSHNLATYLKSKNMMDFIEMISMEENTCQYVPEYTLVIPAASSRQQVEISLDINIPSMQEIVYVPTVLESLKIAWI
jgi:hypothetical protein